MCLQCRFTDLYEYMCHITLIINKGMCQLPPGNQESHASRWDLRMEDFSRSSGIATANQRCTHLSMLVVGDHHQQQNSHSKYSKKGKLDSAQWSKEGAERTPPQSHSAHAYCVSFVHTEIII